MRKFIAILLILSLSLVISSSVLCDDQINDNGNNQPVIKADGSKWKIAYCESEIFSTYPQTLVGIVYGMEEMGWITDLKGFARVKDSGDSKKIWRWLSVNNVSPYIDFLYDGFYNLRDTSVKQEEIISRLNQKKDIDIMLAMGAASGVFLSEAQHNTNVFVFAASNAVRSGIIDSVEDSGQDYLWAHMDESRFVRQTQAFYDIVKFKKLGMVYEDSASARVYSACDEVEKLAEEKGFEIVRYHVTEPRTPEEFPKYYEEVQAAYNKLAQEVDAVYVTIASLESEKLPILFKPFYDNKIPVFSQLGNVEVENGALMTVSVMDEENIGRFGADNIIKCLLGAKVRDLEQSFQSAPKISLNAEVVQKLNFKIPFELIIVVDDVYQSISPAKDEVN